MSPNSPPFDIKSASITGLALVLRSTDMAAIEAELASRVRDAGDLFTNAPVLIDVSALTADGQPLPLPLPPLVELLKTHTMQAVGIVGADTDLLEQAQALGLVEELDIRPRPRRMPAAQLDANPTDASSDPPTPAPSTAVAGLAAPTLVVDRPLRSGQRVFARGGDLVVLGMVSHGAEVIADGSIHVYGPLRGRAVAGANGDVQARIFASAMEPELVSIAGTYRMTDKPLAAEVLGKPAQVRLDGERLLIEALKC